MTAKLTFSRVARPFLASLLITALAAPAWAADPPAASPGQAEASALKTKGDALFRERNYVEAVAAYEQAEAAYLEPRVLYNHARALQALGRNGEALTVLTRFASVAPPELKAEVTGLPALMSELRSHVCEVSVRVNEPGAQITFRDQVLGTTPLTGSLLLEAGQGTLRVEKDGYFTFTREVSLRGGGSASFDVTLGSKERSARLVIKSPVTGSVISIDGRRLAQAPTEALLSPGTHRVLAHREGFADASTQVIVDAGQNRVISLAPLEQHPLLKQWWFWTGVGVVAAAGTTAAVIIARDHRAASDGDFSPSAISAPLGRF